MDRLQDRNFSQHIQLKSINKEIKQLIRHQQKNIVRIFMESCQLAKDLNTNPIPDIMTLNTTNINVNDLYETFVDF